MAGIDHLRVPASRLRWQCSRERFTFVCTDDVAPLQEFVGQDRARQAIEFGLSIQRPGYNIFASGLTGTGKATVIKRYLQQASVDRAQTAPPSDWCYVYADASPDRPRILQLPQGRGRELRDGMVNLLEQLRRLLVETFGGEDFRTMVKQVVDASQERRRELLTQLEVQARNEGFFIQPTPTGIMLVPSIGGKPAAPEQIVALPEKVRQHLDAKRTELLALAQQSFEEAARIEAETAQQLRSLREQVAQRTVDRPFAELTRRFAGLPEIIAYLTDVRAFTLRTIDLFLQSNDAGQPVAEDSMPPMPGSGQLPARRADLSRVQDPLAPFRVNLFVDNATSAGPPIIIEPNPTWGNLIGKIERRAFMGAYFSDHTMLKPGALALANGGYLILNARDVLSNPGSWEGLKRALQTKEIRLEDPAEQFGLFAPIGLRPQPIPLDVKVVLTGDYGLYQLLARADEDFREIFKVQADFDSQIDRNDENVDHYAAFVCTMCLQEKLLPFEPSAVCQLAEHGARLAGHQEKLSTRFGLLKDVMIEADYWARRTGAARVNDQHVNRALDARVHRSSLVAERMQELIANGTILVEVTGQVVGQVNGLAVYDLGTVQFGRPSRITARTFIGREGVIDIERQSLLSGSVHAKGVLILAGYLGATYAQESPLSMTATITFEQSYEGIDGDSASSAELYAILSSLADLPLKQGIAVTGSVNQHGYTQAIGGVNEKIEGFFDVCRLVGLTGDQGVMIPASNLQHLMLREDVVQAVAAGQFHLYAVRTIDEGLEVLTGVPAGQRDDSGRYPAESVHGRVDRTLQSMVSNMKAFLAGSANGALHLLRSEV